MLSVKLGSIKHHILSFWYDSTWDWTPVSWTIGKHWMVNKLKLELFYALCEKKKDWVQTQLQKKFMMWKKAPELSMNTWHKTGSVISDVIIAGDKAFCLKWLNYNQAQAPILYCRNLVLHKTLSVDTLINTALWTDTEILEILQNFWLALVHWILLFCTQESCL